MGAKQPAALPDALEAVERISELLDLSGLFSALLLHPRRDRKSLSYTGGIRVSGLDFGPLRRFGVLPHEGRSTGWLPSPRSRTSTPTPRAISWS